VESVSQISRYAPACISPNPRARKDKGVNGQLYTALGSTCARYLGHEVDSLVLIR